MNSPFPGMDPCLESPALWPDFHARFITYCAEHLGERLPPQYRASIAERVCLYEERHETAQVIPDINVSHQPMANKISAIMRDSHAEDTTDGSPVLAPVLLTLPHIEPATETYIEILHRPGRELVAVIEVLSPSNKTGRGYDDYLLKRNALFRQNVHVVELDFLLDGERLPLQQTLPPGDYYALVADSTQRPTCQVYSWHLADPLPSLQIPLKNHDPPVRLDLAAVFNTTYQRGRYDLDIDYSHATLGAGNAAQQAWIMQWIQHEHASLETPP